MRIESAAFHHFRSYVSSEISGFSGFNFIGGDNAAGKSTILDAFAMCLTGTCRGAETGRGLDELRSGGRAKWSIGLGVILEGGESRALIRQEGEGPKSAAQDLIAATVKISPARIRACLYSGELTRLERKEAQRLILDLCDTSIEIPEDVQALVRSVFEACPETLSLVEMERIHARAYEMRTEAGQRLKALTVATPTPPVGYEGLAEETPDGLAAIETSLADKIKGLREERDRLKAEIASANAGPSPAKAKVAALEAERERLKRRGAELGKEADLAKAVEDLEAKHDKTCHDIRTAEGAHQKAVEKRDELKGRLPAAEAELASAKTLTGKCPTCERGITKDSREAMLEGRQRAVLELEGRITAAESLVDETRKAMGAVANPATQARQVEEAKRPLTELRTAKARLEEIKRELAELGDPDADSDGKEPYDVAAARTKVSDLETRIATGEGRQRIITAYLGAVRAAAKTEASKKATETEHANLDQLVNALGPKGIRQSAAGGTATFQEEINALLAPMGFEADFGPLLRLENDPIVNGRPARMLSSSELIRFGIAFQIAVARWSKLGIVAVDDWERLMPASAGAAQGVLSAFAQEGGQVFIFASIRDADKFREKAAAVEGIRFFLVENGEEGSRIEALATQVAA